MATLSRFKTDQSGTTAIVFGLAMLPVMAVAGATLDYGRAIATRSQVQAAVDATALRLTREAGFLSETQLKQRGEDLVRGYLKASANLTADMVTVNKTAKTIRVAANVAMKTTLMAVAGTETITLGSAAEVAWGAKNIELALVLDNTGSMQETVKGKRKIDELKRASLDLLATLKGAAADKDSIKVAVVPFDTQVRVDAPAHRYATWLDLDPSDRMNWYGYIADRGDAPHKTDYDANDTAADPSQPASMYPAMLGKRGQELAPILPLVSAVVRYEALRGSVLGMQGAGTTNVTIGVAWGMAMLSKAEPFSEAANPSSTLEKIMVVVTDGENTRNRFTSTSGKIDQRTELACAAAKDKGIRVITIRLIEGNAKLLRRCATLVTNSDDPFYRNGEPLYHDVQDPKELSAAFQGIANAILSTRLTH